MTKKIFTIAEAAKYLRVSRQTVYVYRQQHKIESFRIGTRCLFTEQHLENFIKANEVKSAD